MLKYIPSIYFMACLFSIIIYFFSKLNSVNILLISITAFLISLSAMVYFFIKKTDYKLNYFLVHFSTILSLYFVNFFLIFEFNPKTHAQLYEDKGVLYDHRSVIEYVNYLRKEFNTQAVYPTNIMQASYGHFKSFPHGDADFRKIIKEKGELI